MRDSGSRFKPVAFVLAVSILGSLLVGVPRAAGADCGTGPIPVDIVNDGLEITQSVQDGRNRVPLIDGKRTFVRLYSHLFTPDVAAGSAQRLPDEPCVTDAILQIQVGSDTTTIEPLDPNGVETINDLQVNRFRRGEPGYGFLFELPSAVLHGTIGLTGVVNTKGMVTETSLANNSRSTSATFGVVPPIDITFDRVSYQVGNNTFNTPMDDVAQMTRWLRRAFPISDIDWRAFSLNWGNATRDTMNNLTNPTCADLNTRRLNAFFFDVFGFTALARSNTRFYSMIDDAGGFMRGCALEGEFPLDEGVPFGPIASGPTGTPGGNWSWDTDTSYGDWYGAHEIGHTFDRKHILCDGSEAGPESFPYPQGLISPQSPDADAIVGFDVETQETYPFDVGHDLMTYCPEQWISDINYKKLRTRFARDGDLPDVQLGPPADNILVAGTLGGSKACPSEPQLEPIFHPPAPTPTLESTFGRRGKYAIVLKDADGDTLARHRFKPKKAEPGAPYPGTVVSKKKCFTRYVVKQIPFVEGTTQIEVTRGKKVIDAVRPGTTLPTIESVSSDGFLIQWQASDADGDELTHLVQYSIDDGATWRPAGLPTKGTSLDVPRDNLVASPNVRFRVVTTDGLNTRVRILENPILVDALRPQLEIRSPTPDEFVRSTRSTVNLEAFAYDFSSGNLRGDDVVWRSDIDGVLGSDDQLAVTGLTPGTHTITVRATGFGGLTQTRTVSIVVAA